jgi:hypothetical protein
VYENIGGMPFSVWRRSRYYTLSVEAWFSKKLLRKAAAWRDEAMKQSDLKFDVITAVKVLLRI